MNSRVREIAFDAAVKVAHQASAGTILDVARQFEAYLTGTENRDVRIVITGDSTRFGARTGQQIFDAAADHHNRKARDLDGARDSFSSLRFTKR